MLSKEEIKNIKRGLTEELNNTIKANECGLSTNDFSESIKILKGALKYIDKLETDKQKLIEKLEEDIKYGKEFELDLEPTIPEIRAEYAQEILEIVKGENIE